MQIPEHWAEARIVGEVKGQSRSVRRFGWSEVSAEHAQRLAEQRAAAALAELQAGRPVPQRERKLPYGGVGLPIREEVLMRRGDLIVTRNVYGARVLNEPDVLFADVDLRVRLPAVLERSLRAGNVVLFLAAVAALCWCLWHGQVGCGVLAFAVGIAVLGATAALANRRCASAANRTRCEREMRDRVLAAIAAEPGARATLYATPGGLRVLLLHAAFDPVAEATHRLLRSFDSDPAYVQMCALQACFRARVTAKPWRIPGFLYSAPPGGTWPVPAEKLAMRTAAVARYEAAAEPFAACRFLEDVGDGPVHPRCAEVQRVHDELSRARSGLPIA